MPRFFNTTGPCDPAQHYMLPPRARLPDLLPLVERQLYFVVHAPRQTGKTTVMRAFAEELRAAGTVALWVTLEEARGEPEVAVAEAIWIRAVHDAAQWLPLGWRAPEPERWLQQEPGGRLRRYLQAWCAAVGAVPVVLLLDEADTLVGPALVSLLAQLRAGFMDRGPGRFPVSVGLIGMRDMRDYLTTAKGGQPVNPGSPFNVKAESLTLRNFNEAEVAALLSQHTGDTGQAFTPEALARVFHWGRGQPFLTNALAREVTQSQVPVRQQPITVADIDEAKDRLILSRTTHLDSLSERLRDPRVARVIQAVLLGDLDVETETDDYQLTVDLGLINGETRPPTIANPMYREILIRQLSKRRQDNLPDAWWPWKTAQGGLDMPALIAAFLDWWRENGDRLLGDGMDGYPEAIPHLTFMAFLQRVVNGGGRVTREFAAGRGAIDLLVEYGGERHVIELKRVRPAHDAPARVREAGLRQLSRYLDAVGERQGWLLIFDQRAGKTWEERLWAEDLEVEGRTLHLRGA